MAIDDDTRSVIVEVLCSQALADHPGDVRDAEEKLWKLLGADPLPWDESDDEAWPNTKRRLQRAGIDLPEYLQGADDDDE